MSRNSVKAVDLYCSVRNWNDSLANAYPNEIERWTAQRDRKLAAFRKIMAKVTLDEFLSGRWGSCPMHQRLAQWGDMQAMATDGHPANRLAIPVRLPVQGNPDVHCVLASAGVKGGVGGVCSEGRPKRHLEETPGK
jgi:hypothetical protein